MKDACDARWQPEFIDEAAIDWCRGSNADGAHDAHSVGSVDRGNERAPRERPHRFLRRRLGRP